MLKKLIRDKRGAFYIDGAISIVIIVCVFMIGVYALSYVVTWQRTNNIASNLMEVATTTGEFGDEFYAMVDSLRESVFEFEISVDGEYISASSKRVQLGDTMTLTVTTNTHLLIWAGSYSAIKATVTKQGLSQKYWK